jgi:hypothetical protein
VTEEFHIESLSRPDFIDTNGHQAESVGVGERIEHMGPLAAGRGGHGAAAVVD